MRKSARYRGIPCWYYPIDRLLVGKNQIYDFFLDFALWLDADVFKLTEVDVWIDEL